MYCKKCGERIADDSVFCKYCGAEQDVDFVDGIPNAENIIKSEEDVLGESKVNNNEKPFVKTKTSIPRKEHKQIIMYMFLSLLVLGLIFFAFKIFSKPTIADKSIDRVSKELADACKRYDFICINGFHDGLVEVELNDKRGFIDKKGNEIISCQYDNVSDFENGYSIVTKNDKQGVIDINGDLVIPISYDFVNRNKDNTFVASKDDKLYLLDCKGNPILSDEYEYFGLISEGMIPVVKNDKYGFVDQKSGKLVIPCKYEEICRGDVGFANGLCGVKLDDKWGYIDKSGNVVIPFDEYNTGEPFENSFSTRIRGTGRQNLQMSLIDMSGNVSEWISAEIRELNNGVSIIKDFKTMLYGLIDYNGNWIIPCEYDMIFSECGEDGLIQFSCGPKKKGFFDINKREVVIPCVYDIISLDHKFSDGLLPVRINLKCGYMNISQTMIIPAEYDDAYDFSEGLAVVRKYGRYGFVDKYGNDTFEYYK